MFAWTANLQSYENCVKTIKAVTVLHNMLLNRQEIALADNEDTTFETCPNLNQFQPHRGNRTGNTEARVQRDKMAQHFFSGNGQVRFQWAKAFM